MGYNNRLPIYVIVLSLLVKLSYGQGLTNELAWTVKYGLTENLEHLITDDRIDECISVEGGKKYGYLAISIKLNSMECLRYFVENGADIERVCADKTPLMYAAKYGRLEMVRYLLEKGANPRANYRGKTALGFARQFHQREIISYLKEQEKVMDHDSERDSS